MNVLNTKKLFKVLHLDLNEFLKNDIYISKFINIVNSGKLYSILVRVNYTKDFSSEWKMLGEQIKLGSSTIDLLSSDLLKIKSVIENRLSTSMEVYNYKDYDIKGIQFIIYLINPVLPTIKLNSFNTSSLSQRKELLNINKSSSILNKILPLSFNVNDFGVLLNKDVVNNNITHFYLLDNTIIDLYPFLNRFKYSNKIESVDSSYNFYQKDVSNKSYIIMVKSTSINNIISIFDINGLLISNVFDFNLGNNIFTRTIGNAVFYINNKGIFKKDININFNPIYPKHLKSRYTKLIHPDWKIGTLDLETFKLGDVNKIYAIGFYTNKNLNTFYIDNDYNSDNLFIKCLKGMLIEKYNGYTFYVHNLSGYDIFFMLRILVDYNEKNNDIFNYNLTFRDDKIIAMSISTKVFTDKKTYTYNIRIVDSYTMLSSSLDKLSKTFETTVRKTYFPYDFVTLNTLFYVGNKPSMNLYIKKYVKKEDNIDLDTYNNIPSNNWSTKDQTIEYLGNDLISLFLVMEKFRDNIYIKYHNHITNCLTISSLCMDIYLRSSDNNSERYYNNNIPLITQKSVYNDIKSSYFGGITEVYKPYGKNLYYYDVNSLYPFSALNDMPSLKCTYTDTINKNIRDIYNNIFGFYYCKITTNNGYLGLLPLRNKDGLLIMPLGTYEGWYFSEELKYAYDNGYDIQILHGYKFDRSYNTFKKYVDELYHIKSSTSDSVKRAISKSMLNNLIGKFGLDINKYISRIVSFDEFIDLLTSRSIKSIKYISDNKILVTHNKDISENICNDYARSYSDVIKKSLENKNAKAIFKEDDYNDVSVAIASAVTSYSRIYMSKIKMDILKLGGNLFYTDTDSIVTDIKLDDKYIGNEIGKFKLEYIIEEGYFISNKSYAIKAFSIEKQKNVTLIKNKGVYTESFKFEDFNKLYLGNVVKGIRLQTNKDYTKGSVTLYNEQQIKLSPFSYTKRVKIFDNNNLWIDTKPIEFKSNYHTITDNKYKIIKYINLFLLSIILILSYYIYTLIHVDIIEVFNIFEYDIQDHITELIEEEPLIFDNISDNKSILQKIYNNLFGNNSNRIVLDKELKYFDNIKSDMKSDIPDNITDLHNKYCDRIMLLKERIYQLELNNDILCQEVITELDRLARNNTNLNVDHINKLITLSNNSSIVNSPMLNSISNNNSVVNTPIINSNPQSFANSPSPIIKGTHIYR